MSRFHHGTPDHWEQKVVEIFLKSQYPVKTDCSIELDREPVRSLSTLRLQNPRFDWRWYGMPGLAVGLESEDWFEQKVEVCSALALSKLMWRIESVVAGRAAEASLVPAQSHRVMIKLLGINSLFRTFLHGINSA